MRLECLEVTDFRAVRAATIVFGRGVTVLHGPNELGKSTLVEAIHAALFVPTTSQAGNEYVTWGGSSPACVTLTFEHEGKRWRVSKRFGRRAEARLDSSELGSESFREVVSGRGVDGRLRELLAWGIAAPGGRGAPRKAESFLLTALLGRQGAVQGILGAGLDDDQDPDKSGKSLVTRALGALDNDPRVSRILEDLRERVETVFTATGGLRRAADSPLTQLDQRLRTQQDLLESLREDARRGADIQSNVVRLQDERHRLLGELDVAEASRRAAVEQAHRAATRAALQHQLDEIQAQLTQADEWAATLVDLDTRAGASRTSLEEARGAERTAAAAVADEREKLQLAAEAVARATEACAQSGRVNEAARAQKRAEFGMARSRAGARLGEVEAAEQTAAAAARLEEEFHDASAAHLAAVAATHDATRALESATIRVKLRDLRAHEDAAARASERVHEARLLEETARVQLDAAAEAIADAERRRDSGDPESQATEVRAAEAEVLLWQAVESHVVIERLQAEVRALEEAGERARTLRASAHDSRSEASDIERSVASRVLPTREQIQAWRGLEREMQGESERVSAAQPSALLPVGLAALLTFIVVSAAIRVGLDVSSLVAVGAGLAAAALVGGLVRTRLQSGLQAQSAEREQSARRRDRWTREVEPSLRAAGLSTLADYEGAVGELERLKLESQRLRNQADRHDIDAVDAERRAASLESRREELTRLERERPVADEVAVAERAQTLGGDVNRVRVRLGELRALLGAARARAREQAQAAVILAAAARSERQAEYDAAARTLAAAEATLSLARQQCNAEEVTRLEARLAEIGATPDVPVTDASTALDAARTRQAEAATIANTLKTRVDEAKSRAMGAVAALGGDLLLARQAAQRDFDETVEALASLETDHTADLASAAETLERATRTHADLEVSLSKATTLLEAAVRTRSDAEAALAALDTEAAAVRGQLAAINRPRIEQRLLEVSSDPAFAPPEGPALDVAAATAEVERLQRQLERCTNDMNHARGQLHLIAGHVGTERLAQQQEAVALATSELRESELAYRAALRLLREIEAAESERTTHLGRVLAGPVTEAFRTLTNERYGRISFAPDLRTEHLEAAGGARSLEHLSVGTREQLATLLRLAVAGHLQTAVVLDDQLVHSDTERLEWFREALRSSTRTYDHQVVVVTCRPGDYLGGHDSDDSVTAVDLAALIV